MKKVVLNGGSHSILPMIERTHRQEPLDLFQHLERKREREREKTMASSSFQLAMDSQPLCLSSQFILPEDSRPLVAQLSPLTSVPIIDMSNHSSFLAQKVSQACEEYGFFQIINHGFPEELCLQMMAEATGFFQLPSEERMKLYTEDLTVPVKVSSPHLKFQGHGKVTMWSEHLIHLAHPLEDVIHLLPENPSQYREVARAYTKEMADLATRLFGLISQGLGLEKDYLQRRVSGKTRFRQQVNYYPPCPDPELTIGLPAHNDINLLTVLQQSQGVVGLQVMKDGKWMTIDPQPNAFIVNIADQLQVLSNGRYKSVLHRAVTNQKVPRISIATFCGVAGDVLIGPIDDLIDKQHPPIYRSYLFDEFFKEFCRQEGRMRKVKELFELQN